MSRHSLDDGTLVEVEYSIEQRGYPSNGWDDAGEPTIVSITSAIDDGGAEIELTEEDRERIEGEIAELVDSDPMHDDPDW